MPDIHIHRDHDLGLPKARKIAFTWAEKAEAKFDMECTYEEGDTEDLLTFTRSGVKGTLRVDACNFEMHAQLGFLFGAFKDRIETEIGDQLDALLKPAPATAKKSGSKLKTAAASPEADVSSVSDQLAAKATAKPAKPAKPAKAVRPAKTATASKAPAPRKT